MIKNHFTQILTKTGIKDSAIFSTEGWGYEYPLRDPAVFPPNGQVNACINIWDVVRNLNHGDSATIYEFTTGKKMIVQLHGVNNAIRFYRDDVIESNRITDWYSISNLYSSPSSNDRIYAVICEDQNYNLFIAIWTVQNIYGYNSYWYSPAMYNDSPYMSNMSIMLHKVPVDLSDPYVTNPDENPTGGHGPFDYSSETETPPALPALSAGNAGFVTLWNPDISEIESLADYLWGPSFSIASWQKLWNDPMQCLLSLGIIPVSPTTGTRRNIYFGNADTGIESTPVTDQFVTADMGSMDIEGKSASYMDYSPYCKASIFLPYCGTYALDVDEIMDATLSLEYHIDIYTGACVAYLTVSNRKNSDGSTISNIMYQFTGNCLASIPVTSADHSQLLQSLLFMGASIAATVATSGAGAPIEGLAAEGEAAGASGAMAGITAGSAINTVMSMKPNVMHSGNLSSTAGLLGAQKPHVTFTWSNLCRPDTEYKLSGMPLQKSGTLSDFSGFTIVSACHMDNILCTDAERALIEQALGRGVII